MNLEEFVREALLQVVRGVAAAGEAAGKSGAYINPNPFSSIDGPCIQSSGKLVPIQAIEFDVAVVASSESQAGGGAGIRVMSLLSAGGETKATRASQSESRVKFSVPVAFPATKPQ